MEIAKCSGSEPGKSNVKLTVGTTFGLRLRRQPTADSQQEQCQARVRRVAASTTSGKISWQTCERNYAKKERALEIQSGRESSAPGHPLALERSRGMQMADGDGQSVRGIGRLRRFRQIQ